MFTLYSIVDVNELSLSYLDNYDLWLKKGYLNVTLFVKIL